MAERRPLVIGADGCPEELPAGDTLPGSGSGSLPFYDFIKTENGLINQTNSFEDYLVLNTTIPDDGDYEIGWHYEWSYNTGTRDFRAQVDFDGTIISDHIQEPKDSGGSGITLPNTGGGNTNSGTNQRHVQSGFDIQENLTAGSYSITIRFRGTNNNDEPAIYRGRIYIRRVS